MGKHILGSQASGFQHVALATHHAQVALLDQVPSPA